MDPVASYAILQEIQEGFRDVTQGFCREFDGSHSPCVTGVVGSAGARLGGGGRGWPAEDLFHAAFNGDAAAVQAWLANGADVNAKNDTESTALMEASFPGHLDVVQALLANGADVNAKNSEGWTALMGASYHDHLDVVQALLAKGADVNARDRDGGWTVLMWASFAGAGNADVVQALLAKGADVNAKDRDGETALILASCEPRNLDTVQVPLANGANVNARKNDGRTALDAATASGDANVRDLLERAGAKP